MFSGWNLCRFKWVIDYSHDCESKRHGNNLASPHKIIKNNILFSHIWQKKFVAQIKSIKYLWNNHLYGQLNKIAATTTQIIIFDYFHLCIRNIILITNLSHDITYTICGAVCFQFNHFPCDDWENIYTLSYYHHHHQIGSMNYYPLFRVRSWNNGVCCMSFYILITS